MLYLCLTVHCGQVYMFTIEWYVQHTILQIQKCLMQKNIQGFPTHEEHCYWKYYIICHNKKIFFKKLKIILTMVTKSQSKFHLATHSYPSHKIHLSLNTAPRKQILTFTVKPTERHLSRGPQDFLQFMQFDCRRGENIPKGLKTNKNRRKKMSHLPLCPQIQPSKLLAFRFCSH